MIYLVYDYEEHGPTNLAAITNKAKVEESIREHFKYRQLEHFSIEELVCADQKEAFTSLSSINLDIASRYGLVRGWGGAILEIIEEL